jgi:hypothetical protein
MSATDARRVDQTLDGYASAMRWVIARKDFNAFWPIGLPRAGTAMGDALVARVEEPILHGSLRERVPNPTAALLLLFFSTYGMRVAGWSRERRLRYAGALLALVEASKASPLVDPAGRHQLPDPPAPPDHAWLDGFQREAAAFCALAWAAAEALYFCNHRIGTERHGPYPADGRPGIRMVRSVYDLRPADLWRELSTWPTLPQRVDIVSEYAAEEARFDLFANPLFDFDSTACTLRVAVLATEQDAVRPVRDLAEVQAWNAQLRTLVAAVVERVDRMDAGERIRRLHDTMLYAAEGLVQQRFPLGTDEPAGPGREVVGSVDELAHYYDLREDVP